MKVLPWYTTERNAKDLKRKTLSIQKENLKGWGDLIQKHGGENGKKSENCVEIRKKMEGEKVRGLESEIEQNKNKIFLRGTDSLGPKRARKL